VLSHPRIVEANHCLKTMDAELRHVGFTPLHSLCGLLEVVLDQLVKAMFLSHECLSQREFFLPDRHL